MARKGGTVKVKTGEDGGIEIGMPDIGGDDPAAKPTPKEPTTEEILKALKADMDTIRQELSKKDDGSQAALAAAIEQMIQGGNKPAAKPEPKEPDLPDPVTHPKEYTAALLKLVKQDQEQANQQVIDRTNQSQALDRIWADFKTKYPELSDYNDFVEGEVMRASLDMLRQNIDPNQAILADPNGFMEATATAVKERLNAVSKGWQAEDDGEPHDEPAPRNRDTSVVTSRSRPFQGGPSDPGSKEGGSFVSEIQEVQKKTGLY